MDLPATIRRIAGARMFPYNRCARPMTMMTAPIPLSAPAGPRPLLWPALSLARREWTRFVRQRHRVIGALLTPLVFWLLIGAGMGRSLNFTAGEQGPGAGHYLHYFYPGTVLMILLFTAIFSTISIIEDRREGFLQSVLVAPISPMVIVLGKVLGGTVLAGAQGLVFLLLAPLVGLRFTPLSLALALLVMFTLAFALTALGFCIAWRMSSTQGFHAVMNLFLMPMWFLSGALFPPAGAWVGLRWVIYANPLTWGLAALRDTMQWQTASPGRFAACLAVSIAFAAGMFLLASLVATSRTRADLQ